MANLTDLSGRVFNNLTVISYHHSNDARFWLCKCSCGRELIVSTCRLNSTNACNGCVQFGTHKMSKTKEFRAWAHMKNRCHNSQSQYYHRYGAVGIEVCKKWRNSFEAFYADMGPAPSKKHSIDRKNGKLGYSPKNCRWATDEEQNNNRSCCVFIEHKGEKKTLPQWARQFGVNINTAYSRYREKGWSFEDSFHPKHI